jgi:hypothetical protein
MWPLSSSLSEEHLLPLQARTSDGEALCNSLASCRLLELGGVLGSKSNFLNCMVCKSIRAFGIGHLMSVAMICGSECMASSKRGLFLGLYNSGLGMGNIAAIAVWYVYSVFSFTTLQEPSRSRALETCLGSSAASRLLQFVLKAHTNLRIAQDIQVGSRQ